MAMNTIAKCIQIYKELIPSLKDFVWVPWTNIESVFPPLDNQRLINCITGHWQGQRLYLSFLSDMLMFQRLQVRLCVIDEYLLILSYIFYFFEWPASLVCLFPRYLPCPTPFGSCQNQVLNADGETSSFVLLCLLLQKCICNHMYVCVLVAVKKCTKPNIAWLVGCRVIGYLSVTD